jgi:UDP-glucuronate 4-epimerase
VETVKIFLTGVAGFIGFHLARRLLLSGHEVVGIDNLNDYYDVNLKYSRLEELGIFRGKIAYSRQIGSDTQPGFSFIRLDLTDAGNLERLFGQQEFEFVCNLAAQAGVRYSMDNPSAYIDSNISGFLNLLEVVRRNPVKHLVFASSSSVYGQNSKIPFKEDDAVDHPISLYAASKKSNELMAHTYSHLFGIPVTGLRYFTVYGPWGRPDMAPFLFADAILNGRPLQVFNYGNMKRDFTFVEDIIEGTARILFLPPERTSGTKEAKSSVPYRICNIGRGVPIDLMEFIATLEDSLERKAILEMKPMQAGDVPVTWADTTLLNSLTGHSAVVKMEDGVRAFANWFRCYRKQ